MISMNVYDTTLSLSSPTPFLVWGIVLFCGGGLLLAETRIPVRLLRTSRWARWGLALAPLLGGFWSLALAFQGVQYYGIYYPVDSPVLCGSSLSMCLQVLAARAQQRNAALAQRLAIYQPLAAFTLLLLCGLIVWLEWLQARLLRRQFAQREASAAAGQAIASLTTADSHVMNQRLCSAGELWQPDLARAKPPPPDGYKGTPSLYQRDDEAMSLEDVVEETLP